MGSHGHLSARLHRAGIVGAVVVFAAALALAYGTGRAGAAPKMAVLGSAAAAAPSCPQNCQAIGKTTGVQLSIGKIKSPFVVPYPGKIVAWSIKLSAPTQKQIEFFEDFFGGPPEARLSVLKPIQKKIKEGKPIYKLKAQSPVEDLMPFLGQTTTFQLGAPIKVKAGQVVALTVPTWAPAFAVNLGGNTSWMASRKRKKCTKPADIQAGGAQQALGSERSYGCIYKTARLLYSATVVGRP
jgi:hypothetical protein